MKAIANCQELAEAFQEASRNLFPDYKQIQIFIYHDKKTEKPTKETIDQSFANIVQLANNEDRIIFYFCGHGLFKEKTQESYFCLTNTDVNNLEQTTLKTSELITKLVLCQAKEQIISNSHFDQ